MASAFATRNPRTVVCVVVYGCSCGLSTNKKDFPQPPPFAKVGARRALTHFDKVRCRTLLRWDVIARWRPCLFASTAQFFPSVMPIGRKVSHGYDR